MTVWAYHPATGQLDILEDQGMAVGDTLLCSYASATETLSLSSGLFPPQIGHIASGSSITAEFTDVSGQTIVTTYVGR